MLPILFILYAIYIILVGVNNNGPALLTAIEEEKQFIYFVLVIFVIMALWDTQTGEKIAKPFALLIALGFLLKQTNGVSNWQIIATNAKAVLPGL